LNFAKARVTNEKRNLRSAPGFPAHRSQRRHAGIRCEQGRRVGLQGRVGWNVSRADNPSALATQRRLLDEILGRSIYSDPTGVENYNPRCALCVVLALLTTCIEVGSSECDTLRDDFLTLGPSPV